MVALLWLYYSDCCKFSSSKIFSEKSHVQRGREDQWSNCWMSFSWVKFFAFVQISWVRNSRLKRHWDAYSTKAQHTVFLYTTLGFLRQHQYMQICRAGTVSLRFPERELSHRLCDYMAPGYCYGLWKMVIALRIFISVVDFDKRSQLILLIYKNYTQKCSELLMKNKVTIQD